MAERINGGKSGDGNPNVFVLEHAKGRRNKNKIVTSVDWNVSINIMIWMITLMLII